jgi:hypothetical protein
VSDPANEFGDQAIYHVYGQAFANPADGKLQTVAEGFSGTTDRSTPWKTLTELLAAYQQGVNETKVRSLYTSDAQGFLDSIYSNPAAFASFAASVTGMNIAIGYYSGTGMVVFVRLHTTTGDEKLPMYLVQSGGQWLLSQFTASQPREANIMNNIGQ